MKYPKMPAVILVRQGSARLPEKWRLPWWRDDGSGTTLVEHTLREVLKCKHIDQVFVCSDCEPLLDQIARGFGPGSVEENSHHISGFGRVETILRPRVPATQESLDGLRWCLEQQSLQASYCMLVQATFPFINARDLDRLFETWASSGISNGMFLCKPGEPDVPAGCAWIVSPYRGYVRHSLAPVSVPCIDIDTREDYERAVALRPTTANQETR